MDRMRESIFAVLGRLEGKSFLDLFSGSGIVGIEAYSRGAAPVILVEKDLRKRRTIEDNIQGLEETICVFIAPVERFIQRNRDSFDLVYLDPPFDYPHKLDLLQRLCRSRTVGAGTVVLIHAPREDRLPERIGAMRRTDRREYGRSVVSFYTIESPAERTTGAVETS